MDGDCGHTIGFLLPGICPDCTHYDVLWLCRSILPCLSWRYPQQADISKNTLPLTAFVSDGLTGQTSCRRVMAGFFVSFLRYFQELETGGTYP